MVVSASNEGVAALPFDTGLSIGLLMQADTR
jgi:hypothetical protein